MIVCYSKGFVVQHMEKTGGTTVVKSLAPYLEPYDLFMRDWSRFIFNKQGDGISEHAVSSVISMFLGEYWKDFKKFSTVRDPIDIMKSFYLFSKTEYYKYHDIPNEIPPDGSIKAFIYSEQTGYGPDGFADFMFSRNFTSTSPQSDRLHYMLDDGLIVDLTELDKRWGEITSYLGFEHSLPMDKRRVLGSGVINFSDSTIVKIKKHFEKDYDVIPKITGVNWK